MVLDIVGKQVKIMVLMSMNRKIRYVLLLLFALLQGVAPLAHAHVNGHSEDNKIHLEVANGHQVHDTATAVTQATAETEHSSVVSSQPQYKSSDLTPDQHINSTVVRAEVPCELLVLHQLAQTGLSGYSFPYQHPCSRAPPL